MHPRPTPSSPRYAHRYPVAPAINVPQLLATGFVAAGFAVLLGAVALRFGAVPSASTDTPGVSQVSHPLERVREQRAGAVLPLVEDGRTSGVAVAVSSDGLALTVGGAVGTPRGPDGAALEPSVRREDTATGTVVLATGAALDPVPLALAQERFLGESLALVVPSALAGEPDILLATITATRRTATGTGPQSSERSPTVLRVQVAGSVPIGTPAFTLNGELVGLVRTSGAGSLDLIPAWTLRTTVDRALADGTVQRATLGLTGRPSEVAEPGTTGFRIDPDGVTRGSPAALVGLRSGEVVESVNGALVGPEGALGEILLERRPGDRVTLRVRSVSGERSLEVTLVGGEP